ncbi:helix-turn-helix domain-containing protein [Vibrio vulnificus]|uniref:helix-turn-helix domain-containing protein n=1 Tax=Vibrio vulnificus TaxID=672 RepID=UPI0015936A1B|nr:helix-turn-helix domain-containing protein [Vibrio vulnificus]NVC72625.1 hypothetical protein [Vibrio vulnificus]
MSKLVKSTNQGRKTDQETIEKIKEALIDGFKRDSIAEEYGVSTSTVYRIQREMKA